MNTLSMYNQIFKENKILYINQNSCFDLIFDKYFSNSILRSSLDKKYIQYFTYQYFISNNVIELISSKNINKLFEIGLTKGLCFIHSNISNIKKEDRKIIFDTIQESQVINFHPSNNLLVNIEYGIPKIDNKTKNKTKNNKILIIDNHKNNFILQLAQTLNKTYLVDVLQDFNIFDSYESCIDTISDYSVIIGGEQVDLLCAESVGCYTIDINIINNVSLIDTKIKEALSCTIDKNDFDFNKFDINNFISNIQKAITKL
jgi:hypothetical protein